MSINPGVPETRESPEGMYTLSAAEIQKLIALGVQISQSMARPIQKIEKIKNVVGPAPSPTTADLAMQVFLGGSKKPDQLVDRLIAALRASSRPPNMVFNRLFLVLSRRFDKILPDSDFPKRYAQLGLNSIGIDLSGEGRNQFRGGPGDEHLLRRPDLIGVGDDGVRILNRNDLGLLEGGISGPSLIRENFIDVTPSLMGDDQRVGTLGIEFLIKNEKIK